MDTFIYLIVGAIIFALIGRYVASQKGRSESEGLIIGGLLGFLGVIIVALLPSKDKKDV